MKKAFKLIVALVLTQLAGVIGGFFTKMSVDTWYQALAKPFFTPPAWLFAPVWISLYLAMGIAFFLVWDSSFKKAAKKKALSLFLLQLIFNAAWPGVFFGMRNLGLSFVVIIILWTLVLLTIKEFYRLIKVTVYFLLPYFIWVSFATLLNLSILILNKH